MKSEEGNIKNQKIVNSSSFLEEKEKEPAIKLKSDAGETWG